MFVSMSIVRDVVRGSVSNETPTLANRSPGPDPELDLDLARMNSERSGGWGGGDTIRSPSGEVNATPLSPTAVLATAMPVTLADRRALPCRSLVAADADLQRAGTTSSANSWLAQADCTL